MSATLIGDVNRGYAAASSLQKLFTKDEIRGLNEISMVEAQELPACTRISAAPKSRLTPEQRVAALSYREMKKVPAMITAGREPFDGTGTFLYQDAKAGCLRFRKVYAGGDSLLISKADRPVPMKAA